MATPQLSPGVLTREVDLTVGRADNVLDNIGAIAGPFKIGPIDDPINVSTEQDLINVFGKPLSTDTQYEYWMSASNFLSYGGVLKVCRTDGTTLNNANTAVSAASTTLKIKNYDNYQESHSGDAVLYTWAAKNPGTWGNNLKVCVIDGVADQILGINTTSLVGAGVTVGMGVTASIDATLAGSGSTETFTGYLKGIVVGVNTNSTDGTKSTATVKVVSRVSTAGTETNIDYAEGAVGSAYAAGAIRVGDAIGAGGAVTVTSVTDWYDQQTLGLTNSTVFWKTLAPKPETTQYSADRLGRHDEIHVAVVDDTGDVTGVQGNIIEKHIGLSKAKDAISAVNSPQRIYYKDYIADFSANIYAGYNISQAEVTSTYASKPVATGFSAGFTPVTIGDGLWGLNSQGVTFTGVGNLSYTLNGGVDYSAAGGMKAELANIITSYGEFANRDEIQVDYLIMGPGCANKADSQAKANYLISVANQRKDCMAVVGPHRLDLVNVSNTETQTTNLINYFGPLQSSSYATFDSGYKYQYDRFNNQFRYVPANADVAGLMVRTNLVAFPWFSPAGQQRGVINNTIKLAYNPTKAQRDRLYPKRINSFITQSGQGTLLFGDKTALAYQSAFDRINVRRLFLTIEQALERAAQAQLFELNDDLTRANFRNIVAPYLRDIESKRGLYGFLVVCDETNNTPDVIDNNEFRADIFLKPAKSINYVTLTFVATRTGVSFEEVAGRV
jgi:hypothetical protein